MVKNAAKQNLRTKNLKKTFINILIVLKYIMYLIRRVGKLTISFKPKINV